MVAPTRTPQARGVKCDLCKEILSLATWLDQTKLAKSVEEAELVLSLINRHSKACPCIPKNIENLLIGSTHFEIHRILIRELDSQVRKKQTDIHREVKQMLAQEAAQAQAIVNDCYDTKRGSRYKINPSCFESEICEKADLHRKHLELAVDYWTTAMVDQTNPFNTKLALRLGLTHHVVYACYLFKFYKIFDYQLKTSVLMLNIFRSIDGVTANAILHANYLLIRSFMDCGQYDLARQYLRKASKLTNYQDKSHYESILLSCIDCELRLLDENEIDKSSILDELARLVTIQEDDKLQHYYARTLAMSTIIRYIHFFPSRSDNCFEYFHTFRFVCAIIRRCYESSFELVMFAKDLSRQTGVLDTPQKKDQILDHSWIRFAVCDFSFSTFDVLTDFYIRAGMPECLELLFNALSLIASRSGSVYWQSRIACIGARLDMLCHKFDDAQAKLSILKNSVSKMSDTSNSVITDLLNLEYEVTSLSLKSNQGDLRFEKKVILDWLELLEDCHQSIMSRIAMVSIYDCKTGSFIEVYLDHADRNSEKFLVERNSILLRLGLNVLKLGIASLLKIDIASPSARDLMNKVSDRFVSSNGSLFEFNNYQLLLETLVLFADITNSGTYLLQTVSTSNFFLRKSDSFGFLRRQLSSLTLDKKCDSGDHDKSKRRPIANAGRQRNSSRTPWSKRSSRKDTYEVAVKSEENLSFDGKIWSRICNPIEIFRGFLSLSREEILLTYLKQSEPNPNYLLYRQAHELLLSLRLEVKEPYDHDRILYYFTESNSSNTLRYRWMMYEEQQISPYDSTSSMLRVNSESNCLSRNISFSNSLLNSGKLVKSMLSRITEDTRLCQFKYIYDTASGTEHLIIMCLDGTRDLVCIHVEKDSISDEFFENARGEDKEASTIPNRLEAKIEASRRSLMRCSKTRSDLRLKLETDLKIILHDIENDWLGPYRFILCGKITESSYGRMINGLMKSVGAQMLPEFSNCSSTVALKRLLEGAALLTRDEFCSVITALYGCPLGSKHPQLCHDLWLKTFEQYLEQCGRGKSKTAMLKELPKGQVGLMLDQRLEHIPFESLPTVRVIDQGMFRVPSLRMYSLFTFNRCLPVKVDLDEVVYVLDPADNLPRTRERFERKIVANKSWSGFVGQPPKPEQLESWLSDKQLYIFIGHGAGTAYYNKLCKGKGLSAMVQIKTAAIVMGCSSGRMVAEGPELESFGIGWAFILRGAPCYLGLLWDVTDNDIDKYTDSLLGSWTPDKWSIDTTIRRTDQQTRTDQVQIQSGICITDISARAWHACQLKFLVGSTPVIYGLPIYRKN